MTEMKQVKSINYNAILDKKAIKKNMSDYLGKDLIVINGIATGTINFMSKYGENTGLEGTFFAYNLITGETFESNGAFLPNNLTQQLVKILEKGEQQDVEVSCTISIMESDKNAEGFAWVANKPKTEEFVRRENEIKNRFMSSLPPLLEKAKKTA